MGADLGEAVNRSAGFEVLWMGVHSTEEVNARKDDVVAA